MTENEAIKQFEERLLIGDYREKIPEYYEAMEIAISALEEVQQYRSLGTVEEFAELQNSYFPMSQKVRQYEKIGTLKELREAMEKQIPYKPKEYPMYYGQCKCGAVFLDKSTKCCGNCGQRLDWSEEEG